MLRPDDRLVLLLLSRRMDREQCKSNRSKQFMNDKENGKLWLLLFFFFWRRISVDEHLFGFVGFARRWWNTFLQMAECKFLMRNESKTWSMNSVYQIDKLASFHVHTNDDELASVTGRIQNCSSFVFFLQSIAGFVIFNYYFTKFEAICSTRFRRGGASALIKLHTVLSSCPE